MNILPDILSEFDDRDEELNQLLMLLKERVPEGSFQLALGHGREVGLG